MAIPRAFKVILNCDTVPLIGNATLSRTLQCQNFKGRGAADVASAVFTAVLFQVVTCSFCGLASAGFGITVMLCLLL
jgi:hypothetical protein